jgi:hypothetical protein
LCVYILWKGVVADMSKRNRRIISVVLCFLFCFNLFIPVYSAQAEPLTLAENLSDIQGHWAENTIKKWLRQNLVAGYPDGSFKPDQSITRAEFVAIVNRVFNYTQKAVVQFTDLSPEEWYIDDLAKAVAAGYINGYPDGTFRPEQTITRQEVAAILTQIFSLEGTTEELKKFKD